jgi:hypothetical protein
VPADLKYTPRFSPDTEVVTPRGIGTVLCNWTEPDDTEDVAWLAVRLENGEEWPYREEELLGGPDADATPLTGSTES